MEVILKKTKITSSIINQTLLADVASLKYENVIGFCIVKNIRWIVFYDKEKNQLNRIPNYSKVIKSVDAGTENKEAKILFIGNLNNITYKFNTESERDDFIEEINRIKIQSNISGQFFI